MTTPPAESRPRVRQPLLLPTLSLLTLAALATAGIQLWRLDEQAKATAGQVASLEQQLGTILNEVTRIRIEQRSDTKGPKGLLEKLHTYAPLVASSRTAEPDYQNAKREMEAILRAFESVGEDAWQPVLDRMAQLDAAKDYDELKWLVEAAVRIDPKAGKQVLKEILQGHRMPSPRMRWHAARVLTETDTPLARVLLRQVLLTESSRGVDPDRAAAYNLPIPDMAAVATTGFHNFVIAYVRTEDPEMDDTLLMVIGRVEHDTITIQECIEALGHRRCERAVEPIRAFFHNPPNGVSNPIFRSRCIEALAEIQGKNAVPFFEQALADERDETVAKQLQFQLNKLQ